MSPDERAQAIEDIKQEIQAAAQEIHASDVAGCCNRLVDGFLLLTKFLEDYPE
jgi:hypothetical protein